MERWRQEPSSRLNANIKHEWARHGDTIQQIVKQTQYLSSKHIGMNLFLSTIKKPIDAVKDEFSIKCHGTFPRRKGSLLDTPIEEENGMSLLDEQILVEKLEGILLRLKTLKTERQSYFKELKEKVFFINTDTK
jgi:hypothetical protein